LSDASIMEKQDKAMVDDTSFATQMRQVRLSAFGIERSDRERRAQFLVDVRRAAKAADRSHMAHASSSLASLARYVAAVGAAGKLDAMLVERHLEIADGPAVDAVGMADRLVAAVSQAIGLYSAA
jgi:aminopeptidase N